MYNELRKLSITSHYVLMLTGLFTACSMMFTTKTIDGRTSNTFSTNTAIGIFAAGVVVAAIASIFSILIFSLEYFFGKTNQHSQTLRHLGWSHAVVVIEFMIATIAFNMRT